MAFDANDYLSWYVPRVLAHDGAVNLHSSGVVPIEPGDLAAAGGDPWSLVARFEAALAGWLGLEPREVVFTPGATGGTLLALLTLAGPGDDIVVEAPIYEPMLRQAERLGRVRRLVRPGPAFDIPADAARAALTERTSVVMVTEPNNPSGRFAPREQVLELARLAAERGAVLLVNEVYRGYSDRPSYHGAADNVVVVSSFSKLLGAYWARIGWLSAPAGVACRLRAAHQNMGMPTRPAAALGIALLESVEERRRRAAELGTSAVPRVDEWVRRTPGLSWLPPEGPGFGLVALPAGLDDLELAERLHARRGVLVVPGRMFGLPGTLRISWLQDEGRLEEGLAAIADELALGAGA